MLETYPKDVKLIIKHFPLNSHKFARAAAAAALAAGRQGKFWEFHQKLFENYNSLNDDKIAGFARELKLDLERYQQDVASKSIQALISRDLQDGRRVGVNGTPTIFVNGKPFKKNLREIFTAIEKEKLKRAGKAGG